MWDVAKGNVLREFAADNEAITYTGSFSADGKWFVCAGEQPALLVYDLATGTALHRLKIPALRYGNTRGVAISPDSHTLAVGDEQGTIHLVELASGKLRQRLVGGHQGNINCLLFSSDGKRLVSGSTDTTAIVWDLRGRLDTRAEPINAAPLHRYWNDLAVEDAERAYQSIRLLAASPTQLVSYLNKQLKPVASADARHVDGLIANLANDQFTVLTPSRNWRDSVS
jgi:WD40 repeat protein